MIDVRFIVKSPDKKTVSDNLVNEDDQSNNNNNNGDTLISTITFGSEPKMRRRTKRRRERGKPRRVIDSFLSAIIRVEEDIFTCYR